ncbi:aspartic peptidase domain-containing protein [Nemania sp. FL0916]|nr:aspartic peptidase domain-containing protein [Nemania sp. FL0916]
MRASLFLVGVSAIATTAVAQAQKVVPLSFSRARPEHEPEHRHKREHHSVGKRAGTYSQELNNNLTGGGYYAQVALGTPPQPVTLILDTGSSDVWVLDRHADLCESRSLQSLYGSCLSTYEPADSASYQLVDADAFSIQYLDSSGAEGDYIKDTLHVAGASIAALQVGLAENSSINSGLLGIGFNANVAAAKPYPNIIDLLVDQHLIGSKAYSLYLDDLYAETGTVLFGGIDTKKFIGQLKAVDILPDARSKTFSSFTVSLGSLAVSTGPGADGADLLGGAVPVILDSGTTLSYLPSSVARDVYEAFNAVDDTAVTGFVYVSCGLLSSQKDTTLNFQFGGQDGPLIRVPIDEVVLDNIKGYIDIGLEIPDLPFDDVCSFGIQSLSGIYLLGDTFLRSAYVVYDLNNKKIGLAQANVNATGTNVMEITTSGIPLVSGVAAQETPTPSSRSDDQGDNQDDDQDDNHHDQGGGNQGGNDTAADGNSGTGSPPADPSSSSNAAPRTVPALNWEATAVLLVTTFFSLLGAGLFAL